MVTHEEEEHVEGVNRSMTTPTPEDTGKLVVQGFVKSGAKAGDLRHPRNFSDRGFSMPGQIADWERGLEYAVKQG
jgi:hypothetical protein